MIRLKELTEYLDRLLEIDKIPADYSNNGLQVEGHEIVNRAVFAVDASLELFRIAVERDADFIFVHHGISWSSEPRRFTGLTGDRMRTLFCNGISLYAVHLPLDGHEIYGHNACMADMLDLQDREMFGEYCGAKIGVAGQLPTASTPAALAATLEKYLGAEAVIFGDSEKKVLKAGIISGGSGSDGIQEAADMGIDCFVTGEVGHSSYHLIMESGMPVISLGHYCSEKPGVLKMMELVNKNFELEACEFVDIPTGL